jgi:hypothetical protein
MKHIHQRNWTHKNQSSQLIYIDKSKQIHQRNQSSYIHTKIEASK